MIHFQNGKYLTKEQIHFSVDDVGILRGYGIFDFFRVVRGVPVFIEDHLDRFENSARICGMEFPYTRDELKVIIHQLIRENKHPLGYIKMILTGGNTADGFLPGKPNLVILNNPLDNPPEEQYTKGVAIGIHQYQREFPEAKTTNYTMAIKWQKDWAEKGYMDVLYHDGQVISEVSRSNLFIVDEKGNLITSDKNVLHGVTRKKIIQLAKDRMPVEIRPVKLEEVLKAKEVFITSTNKKVMPVIQIGDQIIGNGKPGETAKALKKIFLEYVDEYIKEYKPTAHIS